MTRQAGLRRFLQPPGGRAAGAVSSTVQASPLPGATPAASGSQRAGQPEERCDMCATPLDPVHSHVADLEQSALTCACRACYLLFTDAGAGRGRYRAVPDRYLRDPARPLTAAEWAELDIPVGLAFFLRSSRRGQVCGFYPSPAGATECTLDLQAWARLGETHPLVSSAEDDVEAVLVSRAGESVEYFLVPIDACYELAGRMRMLWRGFDGGTEARQAIDEFLGSVRARARDLAPEA